MLVSSHVIVLKYIIHKYKVITIDKKMGMNVFKTLIFPKHIELHDICLSSVAI